MVFNNLLLWILLLNDYSSLKSELKLIFSVKNQVLLSCQQANGWNFSHGVGTE